MKKQFKLTQDGIDELTNELNCLIGNRGDIAESIRLAREQGDLSENAEYHAAKDEHEKNEGRILEIENILASVELIKKPKGDGKVQLGSTVKLKNGSGTHKIFKVVGTVEADPLSGKISDESPIGKALLGKKLHDDVEIVTPADTTSYKVVEIA